ncbi:MAG: hypothetical protein AVDCRST_MAG36-2491 [uncultured Nocardioidaceae bacterium]|uniref:Uncharacterized protein n=1 Tax=uncultured Nocardioidaceae bacterium TaxID=253824 RepID=A0A6J4MIT7_9ACTN|nr:MAG: hypothetical protein AVDCRST_MAG36-2491 [uncultured Nocardioidaceae bacterium]
MTTEPAAPEPQVHPSSTPTGPQIIPTHGTPAGEPGPGPEPAPER